VGIAWFGGKLGVLVLIQPRFGLLDGLFSMVWERSLTSSEGVVGGVGHLTQVMAG